jgi:2-succinyl-6-hydroxy-2,4-cyclohexadiene-1-carboxylate synthase
MDLSSLYYQLSGPNESPNIVVLLHGFMGESNDWSKITNRLAKQGVRCLAIDLPGHGYSPITTKVTITSLSHDLARLIKSFPALNTFIVGYSMGGRVAYDLLCHNPQLFKAAIIESASPGIENIVERSKRADADANLLCGIENQEGLNQFLQRWYQNTIFGNLRQSPHFSSLLESKKFKQTKHWQQAINQLGVGKQLPYWNQLATQQTPVTYVSGELDTKYDKIGVKLSKINLNIIHKQVIGCGHNTHYQQPVTFLETILETFKILASPT